MDASLYETEIVRGLFGPSIEPVLSSHTCSHNIHTGRLYIASNALCFYSNIFGFEHRLLIPILDITFSGTIRMTSLVIRSKSNRGSSINKKMGAAVDDDEVDHNDRIPIKLVGGIGTGEDGDIALTINTDADVSQPSSLAQSHARMMGTKNEHSKESECNTSFGLLEGFATEKVNEPQKRKQSELAKEKVVKEEYMTEGTHVQEQEGGKFTTQASEDEYILKSFEDRDSVLRIVSILREKANKNSTIVQPHHQNEGNFGNNSIPKRMAAFSENMTRRRRNDYNEIKEKDIDADADTKENDRNRRSKKKNKNRSSSVPHRSEPREIQYSSQTNIDDITGVLSPTTNDSSGNEDSKGYAVDGDVDAFQQPPSSPQTNRWRCFTTPDWRQEITPICPSELPPPTSITSSCHSTIDHDTIMSRSRTSSTEISSEQNSVTGDPNNDIVLSHPVEIRNTKCPIEVNTTEIEAPITSYPPTTVLAGSSLPLPPPAPPKPVCTPSDWEKAKEGFKDYKEIAVKPQYLPKTTCKSVDEFYDLFLADHAPHSIPVFQLNVVGDTSMAVEMWQQQEKKEKKESSTSPSLYSPEDRQRTITFSHPRSATLGPSNVHTTKTQICQKFDPHGLILLISTVVKDIPYSDCFIVEEMWIIEAANTSNVTFSLKFRIRFVKSTMFKKLIINQVRTEVTQWYKSYVQMVMSSLIAREKSIELDLIENNDDSAIKNQSAELKSKSDIQQQQKDSICGLEITKKELAVDTSSPVLLSLPLLEATVQEEKGVETDLSSFWTRVMLEAQKTPTPIKCLIVVLVWMVFHILSLNRKVELMGEEVKAMKIENAMVMKILMNAISIDSS